MGHSLSRLWIVLLLSTLSVARQKPEVKKTEPAKTARAAELPSEETVNAFLQQTFGYNPDLSWKINSIKPAKAAGLAEVEVTIAAPQGTQVNKFLVTEDGKYALVGELMPFGAHPFAADREKLEKAVTGPSRGPANAPVTVVEFSDLQCPHCKEAQPNLDKLLGEEPNVRLIYQNFPLPMHDWASRAADYADCVGRSSNDAFWKFIESIYTSQSDISASNVDEKLTGFADAAGVRGSDIAACADKAETAGRVERSVELGKSLEVDSTPTLFINGRRIGALPYEVLKQLVEFAAKPGK